MRLLLLLLLASCAEPVDVDDDDSPPAPTPSFDALPAAIAASFDAESVQLDATGAALAIWHDGTLYAGATGTKHPQEDEAVEATTLFRIGSITKMLTSTALLAAEDRGELDLDDPVVEHLPGLDLVGRGDFGDVTLHHLLSHTSGISEITPIDGGQADGRLQDFTYSGFPQSTYLMAPAGTFWNYSNPNFSLAGAAVENATERPYRALMREDVFEPLGMDRTVFRGDEVRADGDYASSWSYDWTGQTSQPILVGAESYDDAWSRPAGFAWSSVLDLQRFGRFLVDGDPDVLSASAHADLLAEHVDTGAYADVHAYGYGVFSWRMKEADGSWFDLATKEHGGAIPGYSAELITVPEADLVIATLAAGNAAYYGELLATIWEELLGAEPTAGPDAGIDPGDFERYVGAYQDDFNIGRAEVSVGDDGQLDLDLPDLEAANIPYGPDLTAISRGNFLLSIQGTWTTISVLTDPGAPPDAPTRWLRHRAFVAERDGARGASAPTPHDLEPPLLD